MPTPVAFRNAHDLPEVARAVDEYLAADDAARTAAYATQAYRDGAEARRKAERRLVKLLKPLSGAYTHAGSRWQVGPEGDLFRVKEQRDERFQNRDYNARRETYKPRSQA